MGKKHLSMTFLCFGLILLAGCSSTPPKPEQSEEVPVEPAAKNKFNRGMTALEAEEYAKAAAIFDSILVENPASEFDLIALYDSAAAYEGMGQCKTAGRRYRQAAQASAQRYPRVEAQSLFRLSYAYECLGYPERVIASLLDVQRRKEYLTDEITLAELPARLASAYAQIGQVEMAKKYFAMADEGIKKLRRLFNDRRDLANLLARTYYFMGRIQDRQGKDVDPEAFFTSLRFQQTHLIRAVEMNVMPWSRKADDAILEAYRDLWKYMKAGQASRAKAPYPEQRAYILSWVEGAQQALAELKTLRFPGVNEGPEAERLFSQLEEEERRMKEFLTDYAVSHPLTPESQRREGLRRDGRMKPVK
jgi:hypothetical protein